MEDKHNDPEYDLSKDEYFSIIKSFESKKKC